MAPKDLCQSLQTNDRAALKALIDPQLANLNPRADSERSFQTLKEWLERHDCVASVKMGRGVLRSKPAIKQFRVRVRMTPEGTAERDIGISCRQSDTRLTSEIEAGA